MSTPKFPILLFVYGTLRKDAIDPTEYYLPSYVMRDAGKFPFIEYEDDRYDIDVVGQIIRVDTEEDLAWYDRYEGVASGLYTRERVTVVDEDSNQVDVQVYVKGPAWEYTVIESGDWNEHQRNKKEKNRA